jgi:hypothetical protein
MAKFQVEQKVEIWYHTQVEAETMDEAIELADQQDNWESSLERNWTEEYFVENKDTKEIWSDNGQGDMVKAKF